MFYIDQDDNITYGEGPGDGFDSLRSLEAIATGRGWSKGDVTGIWNGFAGTAGPFANLHPVKMFRNRPYGLLQIWKAIQRLAPKDAAAPKESELKNTPKKKPTKKVAKKAAKKAPKKAAASGRSAEKRDMVIRLISRKTGATVKDIMEETGWLAHSTRGYLSTLRSKHGVKIETERHATRGTIYRAVA